MSSSELLPLAGLRVLITRAEGRADKLATRLQALGAEPVLQPTIAHVPPDDPAPLAAALARLEAGLYEWLLLTSITTVEVVAHGLAGRKLGERVSLKIAAVGPATAAACRSLLGVEPAAMPERYLGANLTAVLGDPAGRRVLLPNADLAGPNLEQSLREAGALVERVIAYRTVPAPGGADLAARMAAGAIDAILFTSGSTARFFVAQVGPEGVAAAQRTTIACIGPATAEVCHELGLTPLVVAEVFTEAGLLEALVAFYTSRSLP